MLLCRAGSGRLHQHPALQWVLSEGWTVSRSPWCLPPSIAAFPIPLLLRWGCGPAQQVPVEMLDGHPDLLPQFPHLQTGLGAA